MVSRVTVTCKYCFNDFTARVADRKRGWGKFCSKSCKAKYQEKITGQYQKHCHRQESEDDVDQLFHPFESGVFGHGQE